jgi:UDPglucose 6-dehydrogenase
MVNETAFAGQKPRISVIGLGKLGSPMAAVFAAKGYQVIGYDLVENNVRSINEGRAPVLETGLQAMLDQSEGRLRATTEVKDAIHSSDVSFIIVPTPSDKTGIFSNRFVLAAVNEIGRVLREKDGFHIVVVTSTVVPGSTGGEIQKALEETSGRKVGRDVGLCYNPEFIALGSVVHDMLHPDFILIGESDAVSGSVLERIYSSTCANNPQIQRMNLVNAEITKISVNTFVTTKISYANMVAEVCEKLPGADASVVTYAIGTDSRIGRKYLRGATGYGGPCFPRDNKAFAAIGRSLGVQCALAEATDATNDHQLERLSKLVEENLRPGARIVVLGLSYKPETNVVEESQGVSLARLLAERGFFVTVYDPLANDSAAAALGDTVICAPSLTEAVRSGDLLIVMTAWPQFAEITGHMLGREAVVIIDPWRVVNPAKFGSSTRVIHPGRGPVSITTEK